MVIIGIINSFPLARERVQVCGRMKIASRSRNVFLKQQDEGGGEGNAFRSRSMKYILPILWSMISEIIPDRKADRMYSEALWNIYKISSKVIIVGIIRNLNFRFRLVEPDKFQTKKKEKTSMEIVLFKF